jgi:ribosomal protein S18 acetylase RimI-like enzyme
MHCFDYPLFAKKFAFFSNLELSSAIFSRRLTSAAFKMAEFYVRKAALADLDAAFRIVEEYYEAAGVLVRDTKEEFGRHYFGERTGVWLAFVDGAIVGCIALRELSQIPGSSEIKRLYVQPAFRNHGIARALLEGLEKFAATTGYDSLYLDSAPGMEAAVRFYRRSGYEPSPRYNDNPQATVFLHKKLIDPTGRLPIGHQ